MPLSPGDADGDASLARLAAFAGVVTGVDVVRPA
jgi:hypothetical protein